MTKLRKFCLILVGYLHLNNSLGLLYASLTYYLGFKPYSDEGIVMGLSSYGNFNKKNTNPKRW